MSARRLGVGSAVLGIAAVGWALALAQTRGMTAPSVWPYLGLWTAMTVAMMLPSTIPMLLLVDRLSSRATPKFAVGYLVVWTLAGVAAYATGAAIRWSDTGVLLIAAGIYQLLPLKQACLRHCRNPLVFLRAHGGHGPLRAGIVHGSYCVGCCAGLMLVLFALGMMSVAWMAVFAAAILAEKLLPFGERITRVTAMLFACDGVWVILA